MTTCTLTDDELIEKTRQHSIKAMKYESLNWPTHNISTALNEHPELLVIELGRRLALANETLKQFTGCGPIHISDKAEQLFWWTSIHSEDRMRWSAYDKDPRVYGAEATLLFEVWWCVGMDESRYVASSLLGNKYMKYFAFSSSPTELKAICEEYYEQHREEYKQEQPLGEQP